MLRLADLIRQGVVTHPGHTHLGGARPRRAAARRGIEKRREASRRMKEIDKRLKKKKFDHKKVADIISHALSDRRPHGSRKG